MKKPVVFAQKWNIHFKLSSVVGNELSFVELESHLYSVKSNTLTPMTP